MRHSSLQRDERGAVMVMGLFMGIFLTGMVYMVTGVAEAIHHRERTNDAADAGALAVGAVHARAMTRISLANRVLEQALITATAMRALLDTDAAVCDDGGCGRAYSGAIGLASQARAEIDDLRRRMPAELTRAALERVRDQYPDVPSLYAFAPGGGVLPEPPIAIVDPRDRVVNEAFGYIEENELAGGDYVVPIEGFSLDEVTRGFGVHVHPIYHTPRMHNGIDMSRPSGTPILAASGGNISRMDRSEGSSGAGNQIQINHGDGCTTKYFHLRAGSPFAPGMYLGKRVSQGEVIGYVGTTGGSTGPHLHFEVWCDGAAIDPLEVLEEGTNPLDESDVAAAYGRVLAAAGVAGVYELTASRGAEEFQVRIGTGAGLGDLERSEAGVLIGSFGEAEGAGAVFDGIRPMGQVGVAQAEYYGPRSLRAAATWHFRLRRFRLPEGEGPGLALGCAHYGGTDCAPLLDETVRTLSGALVR